MGCKKWLSSAPWSPSTFQRRILSLQLIVRSLSPCWMPSHVGTMALDSTGMVPSPGTTKDQHNQSQIVSLKQKDGTDFHCFLTILHFGSKLSLLGVLKQRLVTSDLIPGLTAGFVKQSAVSTGCCAVDQREGRGAETVRATQQTRVYICFMTCVTRGEKG